MDWFSGIIVYLLLWWTSLFVVLPWGIRRDEDGTPKNPHLKRAALITTLVAFTLWLGIYILIEADIISFRELADSIKRDE